VYWSDPVSLNKNLLRRVLIDNKTGFIIRPGKMKHKRRRWVLVLFSLLLTVVLSSLSDFHLERILGLEYSKGFDMLQHGGYYFLLTLFLLYQLPFQRRSFSFYISLFSFSVLVECIQLFTPGRTFSEFDIMSNFLGITLGFILNNLFSQVQTKKN
jgi:VanZ family protein